MRENKFIYIMGYIVVTLIGTLLHFVYKWSGENRIVGLFSAVNESTWEHMKLAFFPMLLFSIVFLIVYIRNSKHGRSLSVGCVAANLAESTLLAAWLIPLMFYTYSGILGFNVAFVDIAIFFLSVLLGFMHLWRLQKAMDCGCYAFIVVLVVQLIAFLMFTSNAPGLGIFIPPVAQ